MRNRSKLNSKIKEGDNTTSIEEYKIIETRGADLVISPYQSFFDLSLPSSDPEVHTIVCGELSRQQERIELIASENLVSRAVLEASGSVLTNKYAEGYPGRRYYGGCNWIDAVEQLAIDRAKLLFNCTYANVQPHSGAQANETVLLALLEPGDTIMGLSLAAGGHLTHGAPPNISGKWFHAVPYGVRPEDAQIDLGMVDDLARKHRPKLIIAGGSAYPRIIDFAGFRTIAEAVGAYFMVDMAHFAGLVAGGVHPSPLTYAHVVTSTTHKTLRGPRGGLILSNNQTIGKKINAALFPGLQGGPLMHIIAAKAVAFGEALQPSFKRYAAYVRANASTLVEALKTGNLDLVSGGTDTHLVLVDLRSKGITGAAAEKSLERSGITCNKNAVPFDSQKPTVTSGIRLGTPAATTRGFRPKEFYQVGQLIAEVLNGLAQDPDNNSIVECKVNIVVSDLCQRFPIYKTGFSSGTTIV